MNKEIIIAIIILIVLSSFIFVKNIVEKKESPDILELTYKINAGIPFKWEWEIEDESVVAFVKSYVVKDENVGAIAGAPVYTNYVFKGIKQGQTKVTFKYINISDSEISKEEKHYINVDENNKISLIKSSNE